MPKVIQNHDFGDLGLLLWRLGSSWRGVGTSWCDLGELLGRLGSQFSVSLAPRWCQDGPMLEPRCSKLAPEWSFSCHLGSHSPDFRGLGTNLRKNRQSQKSNDSTAVLLYFRVLEGLVGRSWTQFWAILATSSAILRHLGLKLEISGQVVGTKMATLTQDGHLDSILGSSWLDFSRQGV